MGDGERGAGDGQHQALPRIVHLTETGSTNADALRLARAGEALPLWVVADMQTGGKGRQGRVWHSGAGNLQASVALSLDASPISAPQLALVAGIALHDAVAARLAPSDATALCLKWPNDLMVGSAKCAGILVEATPAMPPQRGLVAVVGFGVNIVSSPEIPDRPVTYLARHGMADGRDGLLDGLASAFAGWFATWRQGAGFAMIRSAWLARSVDVGAPISVNSGSVRIVGRFAGLDASGALLIDTDDGPCTVTYGDVSLG